MDTILKKFAVDPLALGPSGKPNTCESCGLFRSCRTYRMQARDLPPPPLDVLFVGESPTSVEDDKGVPLVGAAGQFLQDMLKPFKYKWGFVYAVKCHPPLRGEGESKSYAATKQEIAACNVFLQQDIADTQPRIIVCLGSTAAKAVLGPKAPGISRLKGAPVMLGSTYVLGAYHPSNHVAKRMNLVEDYFGLLVLMDQILTGTYHKFVYDIRIVDDSNHAQALRQIATATICSIDTEEDTTKSKEAPEKLTMFMPGRSLLCLGVATSEHEPVWVFPPRYIDPTLLNILRTKTLLGHNIYHDLMSIAWHTGVRLWQ